MMKRRGGYLVVIALLLVIIGASVFPRSAFASACVDSTKYGAVQLFVPPLQKTGDYQLWVRLQSPTNNAKVRIELNNSECFAIFEYVKIVSTFFLFSSHAACQSCSREISTEKRIKK